MIEIKVPANPPGAPEQLFLASLIGFVDSEPRMAKPLSRVAFGIRLIDAAELAKSSGVVVLSGEDHRLLCELLETSELSFIRLANVDPETKELTPVDVNPRLERAYVATILKAKPAESEQLAAAAE